jgi:hypothetical protein
MLREPNTSRSRAVQLVISERNGQHGSLSGSSQDQDNVFTRAAQGATWANFRPVLLGDPQAVPEVFRDGWE